MVPVFIFSLSTSSSVPGGRLSRSFSCIMKDKCNRLIGEWNIEGDGSCMDGCARPRSVDEHKSVDEKNDG